MEETRSSLLIERPKRRDEESSGGKMGEEKEVKRNYNKMNMQE